MLDDGQAGVAEEALHHVLVHAGSGDQHASSSKPWMVPSSPKVPCRTGKMMSTSIELGAACNSVECVSNGISAEWFSPGMGGTTTASPLARTAAAEVVSGSPARR